MMIRLVRTNSSHPDFIKLVEFLDAELAERDGDDHAFYHQFNQIDHLKHVILASEKGVFIGCGAIKELDNNLPPWWIYGFYATIVFAFVYMIRYHVLNADDQFEEYEIEYAEANRAIEEYKKTAKNLVDINTVEVLTEATDLNAGKKIFETNCVACHMADGGGGIGPNLTDKNWILGGGIKNVFRTISEGGRDGKGMVAWKTSLKPLEMAQVASYVLTFQGTTAANPKAAEGDVWIDASLQDVETGKEVHEVEIEIKNVISDSLETSIEY